ncbi:MAG TPA: sialidase family protein [Jatrophihabitans sp.]|nr:sialidase family protein [Jatrophihabitans sp.]
MRRTSLIAVAATTALSLLLAAPAGEAGATGAISVQVVNVSQSTPSGDVLSQNETPIAINPANPANMITGANDWNYNDGCAVNVSFDGGKTWSPTLPNGFVPGMTKYTNDPNVPGTGAYDAAGDPTVAFSPDGSVAYFVCQAFNFTSPYQIALLLNRSYDGGRTWQQTGLTQISTDTGNGVSKGSNGQFPDHENIHVDPTNGWIYVAWAQFNGQSTHSPVQVAISKDRGNTFTVTQVTSSTIRNNQDQRVVTDPQGNAYLTFDNGIQGGKGTALYVSKLARGSSTWSAPYQFSTLADPVCIFPPTCFDISGGQFRAGGTYPVPAFDPANNRLYVAYADIKGTYAQIYLQSAPATDLTAWTAPVAVAPASADQFESELGIAPNGRIDLSFYDRRYSANQLVDVSYATSSNGGASWRTTRVTPAGFDPSQWGVPSGSSFRPFIGDYNGIASTNAGAELTWTGVSQPSPYNLDIYSAIVTP